MASQRTAKGVSPSTVAFEERELCNKDKALLDRALAKAKADGWLVRGIRHSSEGMHAATLVRRKAAA